MSPSVASFVSHPTWEWSYRYEAHFGFRIQYVRNPLTLRWIQSFIRLVTQPEFLADQRGWRGTCVEICLKDRKDLKNGSDVNDVMSCQRNLIQIEDIISLFSHLFLIFFLFQRVCVCVCVLSCGVVLTSRLPHGSWWWSWRCRWIIQQFASISFWNVSFFPLSFFFFFSFFLFCYGLEQWKPTRLHSLPNWITLIVVFATVHWDSLLSGRGGREGGGRGVRIPSCDVCQLSRAFLPPNSDSGSRCHFCGWNGDFLGDPRHFQEILDRFRMSETTPPHEKQRFLKCCDHLSEILPGGFQSSHLVYGINDKWDDKMSRMSL